MASSSTLDDQSFLSKSLQMQYEQATHTVKLARGFRRHLSKHTPLFRLIRLVVENCIGKHLMPCSSDGKGEIPPLTSKCLDELWKRLVAPVSCGNFAVTPYGWIAKIVFLACKHQYEWSIEEMFLTGSEVPLKKEYWNLFLQKTFPKLQEDSHSLFLRSLKGCSAEWANLDSLICVKRANTPEAIEQVENTVLEALKQLVSEGSSIRIRDPKRINSNQGTFFTIAGREGSFDLLFWYLSESNPLPDFFSQKGIMVPIHDLLGKKRKSWPSVVPQLVNITPELLIADKCMNAVRYHSVSCVGADQNFGIFKKLIVMKTKGGLGLQSGLERWALDVFLYCFPESTSAGSHAQQSYFEHLPHKWGPHLVHRLHWFNAMMERKGADEAPHLLCDLQVPSLEDAPEFVKKSFSILKDMPHCAALLVKWWNLLLHLSYLANPGRLVHLGMWEGDFSLCFPLDNSRAAVYQIPLKPLDTISNFSDLKEAITNVDIEMHSSGDLLEIFFSFFNLNGNYTPHAKALNLYRKLGFDVGRVEEFRNEFFPAPKKPTCESSACSSALPTQPDPISSIRQKRDWLEWIDLMFQNSSNVEKSDERVEVLWELLEAWLRKSIRDVDVQVLIRLICLYAHPLRQTMDENKYRFIVNIIVHHCLGEQQLEFLFSHEENGYNLLKDDLVQRLMKEHLYRCLDCLKLLRFSLLLPEEVITHVKEKIVSSPLLPQEDLLELTTYLKITSKKHFAEVEPLLMKGLIFEGRFSELPLYEIASDPLPHLQELFEKFRRENLFEKARAILSEMKSVSNRSFEEESLSLLEMEVKNKLTAKTAREVVKLLASSKNQTPVISERVSAISSQIITSNLNVDSATMVQLWSICKKNHPSGIKNIPTPIWKRLLTTLARSQCHLPLGEAVFQSLQREPPHWDEQTEQYFKAYLSRTLAQKREIKKEDPQSEQILHVVYILNEMINWNDKFDGRESLTTLVIRSMSFIVRNHPLELDRLTAWQFGGLLFQTLSSGNLTYDRYHRAHELKNEFKKSGLIHGYELIEIPRKDPLSTLIKMAPYLNMLVVISVAMAIWHCVFQQNSSNDDSGFIF